MKETKTPNTPLGQGGIVKRGIETIALNRDDEYVEVEGQFDLGHGCVIVADIVADVLADETADAAADAAADGNAAADAADGNADDDGPFGADELPDVADAIAYSDAVGG
jgi:hypothetical protein